MGHEGGSGETVDSQGNQAVVVLANKTMGQLIWLIAREGDEK